MATVTVSIPGVKEVKFNILPETAAWSYAMKIQSFDTYDGRVIQLLACNVESLSVEGYIMQKRGGVVKKIKRIHKRVEYQKPKTAEQKEKIKDAKAKVIAAENKITDINNKIIATKNKSKLTSLRDELKNANNELAALRSNLESVENSIMAKNRAYRTEVVDQIAEMEEPARYQWEAMREFERNVKDIMAAHELGGRALANQGKSVPARLVFSEIGWNGDVYLTGYNDVRYEPDIPAVRYTLKFDVVSGFDSIKDAASSNGLENIADGVGWVRSVYNTPSMSWDAVKDALGKVIDDAGTHDASNPADFLKYLDEAQSGGSEDGDSEKTSSGSLDVDYLSNAEKVLDKTKESLNTVLTTLGLIGKK